MVCSHATTAPKIPPSASTPLRRSADHPRAAILGAVEGKRWTSLHRKSRHHLLPPPLPPNTKLPHPQSSPNQHLAVRCPFAAPTMASAPSTRIAYTTLRQNEPILPDPPLCLQTENLRRFNSPRPRPGKTSPIARFDSDERLATTSRPPHESYTPSWSRSPGGLPAPTSSSPARRTTDLLHNAVSSASSSSHHVPQLLQQHQQHHLDNRPPDHSWRASSADHRLPQSQMASTSDFLTLFLSKRLCASITAPRLCHPPIPLRLLTRPLPT